MGHYVDDADAHHKNPLCKYKNVFGEPKKGLHSIRIFNIAVVDVALTVIAAVLLSKWLKTDVWWTLLFMFLLGIVLHRAFCVKTTVDDYLFDH